MMPLLQVPYAQVGKPKRDKVALALRVLYRFEG